MTALQSHSAALVAVVCFAVGPPRAVAQSYTTYEIKYPGASSTFVAAINAAGVVIGSAQTGPTSRGFVFERGVVKEIETFGGANSFVSAINAAGDVVGTAESADGQSHAYFWRNGIQTKLTPPGFFRSSLVKMNSAGEVIGWAYDGRRQVAFFAKPTQLGVDLSVVRMDANADSGSFLSDLNDAGLAVGNATINGAPHAVLYDGRAREIRDLGTFGGIRSSATLLTASGDILGDVQDASLRTASFVLMKVLGAVSEVKVGGGQ